MNKEEKTRLFCNLFNEHKWYHTVRYKRNRYSNWEYYKVCIKCGEEQIVPPKELIWDGEYDL